MELTLETRALIQGFVKTPYLNRLTARVLSSMRPNESVEEQAVATLHEALQREPGLVFRQEVDVPAPQTRRKLLAVDKDLQPYYGYIEPALAELATLGLFTPYAELWRDYFLRDNAIYRVNVSTCICAAAAVLVSGKRTRAGVPTALALSMRPLVDVVEEEEAVLEQAVAFLGALTLDVKVT